MARHREQIAAWQARGGAVRRWLEPMSLGVIVLAAGAGTRMRSALPKVLHPLCGRPMLDHVLDIAAQLDADAVTVVLAPDTIDAVGPRLTQRGAPAPACVAQHERRGTGHATLQARATPAGHTTDVLVLLGDAPLLRPESARAIIAARRDAGALVGVLSFRTPEPAGYGRIVRDAAGIVRGIVEERAASPAERAIDECNSGVLCFDGAWLWPALASLPANPASGEYYLTDLVAAAIAERGPGAAVASIVGDAREAWGVNDRQQLAAVAGVLHQRILDAHMRAGVMIINPATVTIDHGVVIGRETTILPGSVLCGTTAIGAACVIGPHATVIDATIADRVSVRHSYLEACVVPSGVELGPFATLRGTGGAGQ
jgi:bifunctional UDP-N-acetylglucosamine pyrophosphorylase/glucosamine-1-phosphate N-acetyltransferase